MQVRYSYLFQQEQLELNRLFEKYVPPCIEMIVEGIMDGKQGEKLKTIVPQTDLNMVIMTVSYKYITFLIICNIVL